jgi:hypothetical protein
MPAAELPLSSTPSTPFVTYQYQLLIMAEDTITSGPWTTTSVNIDADSHFTRHSCYP